MICRAQSNQRHTAQPHLFDVTVHYRFHPRHGERLGVIRQHGFRGERAFVVEQRDGTLTHLPMWMAEESASRLDIVAEPRFSLDALTALRRIVEGSLSLQAPVAQCGGDCERSTTEAAKPATRRRAAKITPNRHRRAAARTARAAADRRNSRNRRRKS